MIIESGRSVGCLKGADDALSSFIVRTQIDYELMVTKCGGSRKEWLPPSPGREEILIYVSREDSGCKGCLDIVDARERNSEIVVEVEGGFQGACEMLITLGAWALIPNTDMPVRFVYHEALCPDNE
jgi:hypothetical protein